VNSTTKAPSPPSRAKLAPSAPRAQKSGLRPAARAAPSSSNLMALHAAYGNGAVARAISIRTAAPAAQRTSSPDARATPPVSLVPAPPLNGSYGPTLQTTSPSKAEPSKALGPAAHPSPTAPAQVEPGAGPPAANAHSVPAQPASTAQAPAARAVASPATGAKTAPGDAKVPAKGPAGTDSGAEAHASDARSAIASVITAVQHRAAVARKHAAPSVSVASAQAAAVNPHVEQQRAAATQTVLALDAAKSEEVKRDEFKAKLKKAIDDATQKPKTEDEAENVMKTGATQASGTLRGELAAERDEAAGPMKSAAKTEVSASSQPAPPGATLQSETIGSPPAPIPAAAAVPAPLPAERLDYSADRGPADQMMTENNLTPESMQEANDPAFGPVIAARSTAEKHEASVAARYRQGESKVEGQAQVAATQALTKDLSAIHGAREQQIGKVVSQQLGTQGKDAQERQRITDTITGIKDKTRADVEAILSSMETEASKIFDDGLKRAEKAYEDTFEEAKGGIGTWLTTWGSDWEKLIEKSLATARKEYLREVDVAIDDVATLVDGKLKAAKERVAVGLKEVEKFVGGLDTSVKRYGEEALQAVSADFDSMVNEIDQRRDGLINKLTEQYKASYERMSAMEEKLREENKSLWQRVYDATVGLIKKIVEFKNMLLGVLGRAASVVLDIIAHPIRFLDNLVSGVMLGLRNFMSKIETYLVKGLMDWLFGALAGAGLQLPDKFDLQGIVSIVLQILGLTYANFRARAVAIVGERVVASIEKTAEVFKVIVTEGIPGLWRFIKDQLGNLKSMVLDAIFDFIKEKVIMAGITWIIGLLNPASAFFKACKAIYDIVMFFVNRGSQILALVNAVIDSIAAIAKGAIGAAAGLVENALAKAIPVAIGFLAGLLGLGDPSKPVRGFIEKAQAPVNKAIDWVINLAVKGVKAIGKVFGKSKAADRPEFEEVKGQAAVQMKTLIGPETTADQAIEAAKQVERELAPQGLKRLTVVHLEEGWRVDAEASPVSELFQLLPKHKGYSVRFAAKLYLAGERDPVEGTKRKSGFSTKLVRTGRGKGSSLNPISFAQLFPPDYQVLATGIIARTDRRSLNTGEVIERSELLPVAFATGNTGDAKSRSNSSHAEEQFAAWFRKQTDSWQERVKRIEMFITLGPCGNRHQSCVNSPIGVRQAAVNCEYAEIVWSRPWVDPTGETTTTEDDRTRLISGGFNRVDGPVAGATEGSKQEKLEATR
jgi:hypothetical protein